MYAIILPSLLSWQSRQSTRLNPEGGHIAARPDASSSSIKPLTTRDNLKTQPILSLKPEALHNDTLYNVIIGTLRGNFQCGNIVRIELIAKKGNSLADRRQLRVFSQNNCLLFTVYATESLLMIILRRIHHYCRYSSHCYSLLRSKSPRISSTSYRQLLVTTRSRVVIKVCQIMSTLLFCIVSAYLKAGALGSTQ